MSLKSFVLVLLKLNLEGLFGFEFWNLHIEKGELRRL
jgi:hypothetical protein